MSEYKNVSKPHNKIEILTTKSIAEEEPLWTITIVPADINPAICYHYIGKNKQEIFDELKSFVMDNLNLSYYVYDKDLYENEENDFSKQIYNYLLKQNCDVKYTDKVSCVRYDEVKIFWKGVNY